MAGVINYLITLRCFGRLLMICQLTLSGSVSGFIVHTAAVLMMRAGHTWASVLDTHMRLVDLPTRVSLIGHTGCLRPPRPMRARPERVDSSWVRGRSR